MRFEHSPDDALAAVGLRQASVVPEVASDEGVVYEMLQIKRIHLVLVIYSN